MAALKQAAAQAEGFASGGRSERPGANSVPGRLFFASEQAAVAGRIIRQEFRA
jgi:hypothetical protein